MLDLIDLFVEDDMSQTYPWVNFLRKQKIYMNELEGKKNDVVGLIQEINIFLKKAYGNNEFKLSFADRSE